MGSSKMSGKERLLAAIRHQPTDRCPVSPRIWAWLIERYGDCELASYLKCFREFGGEPCYIVASPTPRYEFSWPDRYDLPDVTVEQTWRQDGDYRVVQRTFHTPAGTLRDAAKVPPKGAGYGISPNPTFIEHLVKSKEDLAAMPYLQPPIRRGHDSYHQACRMMGDAGLVELYIYGPLDNRAADARGMSQLMIDYFEDREFFDAQIAFHGRRMLAETEAALADGVEVIFGSWFYESLSSGWSPTIWRESFLPWLKRHVEMVHSAGALYNMYDDGKVAGLLDLVVEAGVDVFETCTPPPVGDFDLAEAKKRVGERLCLKGCIDLLYVLKQGTPEVIDRTVRQVLKIGKSGGGFILGTSDSIRDGTPIENVRAYFEAALKYG